MSEAILNQIYHSLGSLESKQDAVLDSVTIIHTNLLNHETRILSLEKQMARLLGYGCGFATIVTIVGLILAVANFVINKG